MLSVSTLKKTLLVTSLFCAAFELQAAELNSPVSEEQIDWNVPCTQEEIKDLGRFAQFTRFTGQAAQEIKSKAESLREGATEIVKENPGFVTGITANLFLGCSAGALSAEHLSVILTLATAGAIALPKKDSGMGEKESRNHIFFVSNLANVAGYVTCKAISGNQD